MFLLFLAAAEKTTSVSGSGAKRTTCEKCEHRYSYVITREATGKDKTWFSWTDKISQRKAEADALKNLAKILETDVEAAPCPQCQWVQSDMVEALREGSYKNLKALACVGLLMAAGGLALAMAAIPLYFYREAHGGDPRGTVFDYALVCGMIAFIGGTPGLSCWVLRRYLNARNDPNRHSPMVSNPHMGDPHSRSEG